MLAARPSRFLQAAAPHWVGLATADLESRVVAVDLATGKVRRHIPTIGYPRSIDTVGTIAVVTHAETGAVTLIDGHTLEITHLLTGFGEPRYTAAHPDGRHAYVTDAKAGELVTVDVLRGVVLARTQIGMLARHTTIDPMGTRVWASLGSKAQEIATVDISDAPRPKLLGTVRPPLLAHDVGWSPDHRHVWVSAGADRAVLIYDTRSGRFVKRLAADGPPQHITFDKTNAYVTSGLSGTLRVYDLGGTLRSTTRIPAGSYNVQQSNGWIVTAALGHGSLTILDDTGKVLRKVQVARSSHDACVVPG